MSGYLKPPTITIPKPASQSKPIKISGSSLGGGKRRTKPYVKQDGKDKNDCKKKSSTSC
jgi:hypothetical protein